MFNLEKMNEDLHSMVFSATNKIDEIHEKYSEGLASLKNVLDLELPRQVADKVDQAFDALHDLYTVEISAVIEDFSDDMRKFDIYDYSV